MYSQSQSIAGSEGAGAGQRNEPAGPGFLLTLGGAPEDLDGVAAEDADHIAQQNDAPGRQEEVDRDIDSAHGHPDFQVHRQAGDIEQQQVHQLAEHSAGKDSADEAADAGEELGGGVGEDVDGGHGLLLSRDAFYGCGGVRGRAETTPADLPKQV